MKKILVFQPAIAPYRIDLFNMLAKKYELQFCMLQKNLMTQKFNQEKIKELLEFSPILRDQYYRIPFIRIRKHIFRSIHEYNPDIILVSECGYTSIAAIIYKFLFRKKYKIFSFIDDSYDMLINDNQFSQKHKYAEKVLIPLFDNIINVEPRVTKYFQEKYQKGIYFPIVQDERRIREIYKNAFPISTTYIRTFNLANKKTILYVGRLVKCKNISLLIHAFNKLKEENTSLIIVGSGEQEGNLKKIAANNSNIIFTGRLEGDNLYAWYNVADIFVLPSIQEAFGAVTNEALIGGCYCLISEKAGSSCLIEENNNGNIFNPDNEEEFIYILKNALNRPSKNKNPLEFKKNNMVHSFQHYIKELLQALDND